MNFELDMTMVLRIVFFICIIANIVSSYFANKARKAYKEERDRLLSEIERIGNAEWNRVNRSMGNIQMREIKVTALRKEND